MSVPIDRDAARHYRWGMGCDGWHLVERDGLSVIEERMPAGSTEARHAHQCARQFFYVLTGTLQIELEEHAITLQARQGLEIAPGRFHRVHNSSDSDVSFLVISQPPAQGDRVL